MDRKRITQQGPEHVSKNVIVGVSGGIAAYKSCTVVRRLCEAGHQVRVVPTESALNFVGAATFEALTGQPVHTGVFEDVPGVPHVRLGQQADLVVVAPATADLLARAVAGRADDLLTARDLREVRRLGLLRLDPRLLNARLLHHGFADQITARFRCSC